MFAEIASSEAIFDCPERTLKSKYRNCDA